jgi:zinc transport system substrate-binding protein
MLKKLLAGAAILAILLCGCSAPAQKNEKSVAATTWPVCQFAQAVAEGTGVTVARVISEPVSCLHDYSLSVRQMEAVGKSAAVIISGAGLEDFMKDALAQAPAVIDASEGIETTASDEGTDPHVWMDVKNAETMVENIAKGLAELYPNDAAAFQKNADAYCRKLAALDEYGKNELKDLSCRELVTFHDGFTYFAKAYDLTIAASIEEEAGSEASAKDLKGISELVKKDKIPGIFVETNGSTAAASVVSQAAGVKVYTLDMCLGKDDYLTAMKKNFDTIKGALG